MPRRASEDVVGRAAIRGAICRDRNTVNKTSNSGGGSSSCNSFGDKSSGDSSIDRSESSTSSDGRSSSHRGNTSKQWRMQLVFIL